MLQRCNRGTILRTRARACVVLALVLFKSSTQTDGLLKGRGKEAREIREIKEFKEIREIREVKEVKEYREFREFRELE